MGLICFALPLVLLGVFLLAVKRRAANPDASPNDQSRGGRRVIGVAALLAGLLAAFVFEPYFKPERYLKTIEEHATPLVAAIDAYDARHGVPPDQLQQLLPEFLESLPTTGCSRFDQFYYQYVSGVTQPRYKLTVPMGGLNIDEDPGFYFDSWSRRWGYSDR